MPEQDTLKVMDMHSHTYICIYCTHTSHTSIQADRQKNTHECVRTHTHTPLNNSPLSVNYSSSMRYVREPHIKEWGRTLHETELFAVDFHKLIKNINIQSNLRY